MVILYCNTELLHLIWYYLVQVGNHQEVMIYFFFFLQYYKLSFILCTLPSLPSAAFYTAVIYIPSRISSNSRN